LEQPFTKPTVNIFITKHPLPSTTAKPAQIFHCLWAGWCPGTVSGISAAASVQHRNDAGGDTCGVQGGQGMAAGCHSRRAKGGMNWGPQRAHDSAAPMS